MPKLIFHFGMNKTGSTAIQSSLAAAAGTTFVYPALGEPPYKPLHEDALDQIFSNERLQRSGAHQEPVGTDLRTLRPQAERRSCVPLPMEGNSR